MELSKYTYSVFADTRPLNARINALDNASALRIAVMPWVVGRVFWDYVDSVIDLTKLLRFPELKPLNRQLRALHDDFERKRSSYISKSVSDLEADKAEELQAMHRADFSEPYKMLREHITEFYPGVESDVAEYLAAIYMAIAIGNALWRFCYGVDIEIDQKLGVKSDVQIFPKQIRVAKDMLKIYLGDMDKALRPSDLASIADGIYQTISNHGLTFPDIEHKHLTPNPINHGKYN